MYYFSFNSTQEKLATCFIKEIMFVTTEAKKFRKNSNQIKIFVCLQTDFKHPPNIKQEKYFYNTMLEPNRF